MNTGARRPWSGLAFGAGVLLLAGAVVGVVEAAIGSRTSLFSISDAEFVGFTVQPGDGTWWTRFLRAVPTGIEVALALLLVGIARPAGLPARWFRVLVAAATACALLPVVNWLWNQRQWSFAGVREGVLPLITAVACIVLAVLIPRGLASAAQESGGEGRHISVIREQEEL